MLGLQLSVNGRKEGSILSWLTNLNCHSMSKQWTKMQEHLGKEILEIGDEVLAENLDIEMRRSSPMNDE
jgi:hypothetical protein